MKSFSDVEVTEPGFRKMLLTLLGIPVFLLILGIYHGFAQTLYRAGILKKSAFLGLEYYQGLTLHGVVNAIVFTTFFAVVFGHAVMVHHLRRQPNFIGSWISFLLMLSGLFFAAAAILSGEASVLYTFYPPLKAHPLFYIGATLIVVGSWCAFFSWIPLYLTWRRENPNIKPPLAVLGMMVTFIVWFMATIPLAVEVIGFLIPWSLGWIATVNVMLARTLFWFFGHALVYFWLLPAYVMFYTVLPKVSGGKLYSDAAGRFAFMAFILLSSPVGLHHQFGDPSIGEGWKMLHTFLTLLIALPSFVTAFTLAASMEYGARARGGKGLFGWWTKLPYFDEKNYLFAYFFCGLVLFLFGGITGIINSSYSMNNLVHNTSWVPGHFHTTVGGPVFLSFLGMTLFLICQLAGKRLRFPKLNLCVPYLWLFGVSIFSFGLSLGGLRGEPRRTNQGLTYLNPESPLFRPDWKWTTHLGAIGGTIMFLSFICFLIVIVRTVFSRAEYAPTINLPNSEPLHDESVGWLRNLRPWIIAAVIVCCLAYAGPLKQVWNNSLENSSPYNPNSPLPESR